MNDVVGSNTLPQVGIGEGWEEGLFHSILLTSVPLTGILYQRFYNKQRKIQLLSPGVAYKDKNYLG